MLSSPAGALPELQAIADAQWLPLEEPIHPDDIVALLGRGRPPGQSDLWELDLDNIVGQHLHAYDIARCARGYEEPARPGLR